MKLNAEYLSVMWMYNNFLIRDNLGNANGKQAITYFLNFHSPPFPSKNLSLALFMDHASNICQGIRSVWTFLILKSVNLLDNKVDLNKLWLELPWYILYPIHFFLTMEQSQKIYVKEDNYLFR